MVEGVGEVEEEELKSSKVRPFSSKMNALGSVLARICLQ